MRDQYPRQMWLTVQDRTGQVVGAAMRTLPHYLVASRMPAQAVAELAGVVRELDLAVPGLLGPADVVEELRGRLAGPGAVQAKPMRELIRVLDVLADPPGGVPGAPTPATLADLDLLVAWKHAFDHEVGMPVAPSPQELRATLPGQLERIRCWRVAGECVAMAGFAPLVRLPGLVVARINDVYTPPDHRRHGYAAAVTHSLARELLGYAQLVMLFTDAANPTSNGVYARLGFVERGEVVEVPLT
jgi:RimJ/RimL family protein N-acetyltransferase